MYTASENFNSGQLSSLYRPSYFGQISIFSFTAFRAFIFVNFWHIKRTSSEKYSTVNSNVNKKLSEPQITYYVMIYLLITNDKRFE